MLGGFYFLLNHFFSRLGKSSSLLCLMLHVLSPSVSSLEGEKIISFLLCVPRHPTDIRVFWKVDLTASESFLYTCAYNSPQALGVLFSMIILPLSPLHLRVREIGWVALSLALSLVHWSVVSFFKQSWKTCSIRAVLISYFTHSHLPPPWNKMKTSISVLGSQVMTQRQWNLFLIWVTNSYLTIQVIFLHIHPSSSNKLTGGDSIRPGNQTSPLTPWDGNSQSSWYNFPPAYPALPFSFFIHVKLQLLRLKVVLFISEAISYSESGQASYY